MKSITKKYWSEYLKGIYYQCYKNIKRDFIIGDKRIYEDNFIYLAKLILSPRTRDETIVKMFDIWHSKSKYSFKDITMEDIENFEVMGIKKKKEYIKNLYLNWDKYKNFNTIDSLLTIQGVGRKIANIYLNNIFNLTTIGIDTHIMQFTKKFFNLSFKNQIEYENFFVSITEKKYLKHLHNMLYRVNKFGCASGIKKKCIICSYENQQKLFKFIEYETAGIKK